MPFNSVSFDEVAGPEESVSCCKIEKLAEIDCQQSTNDHKNCDGDCSTSCCCIKTVLKNEKYSRLNIVFNSFLEKVLDTYDSKYKYLFNSYLDKPPIHLLT